MLAAPNVVSSARALGIVVLPELVLGELVRTLPLLVNRAKNPASAGSSARVCASCTGHEGQASSLTCRPGSGCSDCHRDPWRCSNLPLSLLLERTQEAV